jgi:glycerol-3-phosphate acyltransferase PlsY
MPDLNPVNPWALTISVSVGYALGSIPFGALLLSIAGFGDADSDRLCPSGWRGRWTRRKAFMATVFVLDALKGMAAVTIESRYGFDAALAAGLGAFIGHAFPIWSNVRGGSGVATCLGVVSGLVWWSAVIFALAWLLVTAAIRPARGASPAASVAVALGLYGLGYGETALLAGLFAAIILLRQRMLIRRGRIRLQERLGPPLA